MAPKPWFARCVPPTSDGDTVFVYQSKRWWAITIFCAVLPLATALLWLNLNAWQAIKENPGSAGCPCITEFPTAIAPPSRSSWQKVRATIQGVEYQYPARYGLSKCSAFDAGLEPYCSGATDLPPWCGAEWCYIDSKQCNVAYEVSVYFRSANLAFSFETCGSVPDGWATTTSSANTQAGG